MRWKQSRAEVKILSQVQNTQGQAAEAITSAEDLAQLNSTPQTWSSLFFSLFAQTQGV